MHHNCNLHSLSLSLALAITSTLHHHCNHQPISQRTTQDDDPQTKYLEMPSSNCHHHRHHADTPTTCTHPPNDTHQDVTKQACHTRCGGPRQAAEASHTPKMAGIAVVVEWFRLPFWDLPTLQILCCSSPSLIPLSIALPSPSLISLSIALPSPSPSPSLSACLLLPFAASHFCLFV
jgi:hypothetical protein